MNRERFIRQRRTDWQQFEALMGRLKTARNSRWRSQDIADLSRLYRSICYDLSLVQSREWGSRLEQYLNDLVAQGHNCLYRSPPKSITAVSQFLAAGFPCLLRKRKWSFLVALGLFAVPFLVSTIVGAMRPDLAELVVGKESLDAARESYSEQFYNSVDDSYAAQRSVMAGFYVRNNVGIAFQAFALGAFVGIGTAVVLLSNGISIGMVTGHMISVGFPVTENFFSFVISHGSFELTAIVVAGAAGLVLGRGIMFPGNMTRIASLQFHGRESLLLALGSGAMLGVAAMIEAFFSPLPIAAGIKYLVGTILWILVIMYLTLSGRNVQHLYADKPAEAAE